MAAARTAARPRKSISLILMLEEKKEDEKRNAVFTKLLRFNYFSQAQFCRPCIFLD
jgi:hypothetical protein